MRREVPGLAFHARGGTLAREWTDAYRRRRGREGGGPTLGGALLERRLRQRRSIPPRREWIRTLSWILLLGNLTGCSGLTREGQPSAPPTFTSADSSGRAVPVEVGQVRRETLARTLRLTGRAEAWDEFSVSSQIAGRVIAVGAEEGEWVRKDQVLAELDREKRTLELRSRQASLERVRIDLGYARKKLARGQALLAKGAISESEVDTLRQAADGASSRLRLARIAVDLMKKEIEETRILSPVEGQVARRSVSLGETVSPGVPLFTIIQLDPLKVRTEIAESDLGALETGRSVAVSFDAWPARRFDGSILRILPVSDPQSGSFPLEIRLANPRHRLRPGMVARLALRGHVFRRVLTVPLDAVLEDGGRTWVFVVRDQVARRQFIRILERIGERAICEAPLQPGQQVITRGNHNMTDGTPVEVIH